MHGLEGVEESLAVVQDSVVDLKDIEIYISSYHLRRNVKM
jgi:hypothetical protein